MNVKVPLLRLTKMLIFYLNCLSNTKLKLKP